MSTTGFYTRADRSPAPVRWAEPCAHRTAAPNDSTERRASVGPEPHRSGSRCSSSRSASRRWARCRFRIATAERVCSRRVVHRWLLGLGRRATSGVGRPRLHGTVDEEQVDRPDHGSDESGHLHRAVVDVGAEQYVAEEPAEEAAERAEWSGVGERHRVGAGLDQSGRSAGDEAEDQQTR